MSIEETIQTYMSQLKNASIWNDPMYRSRLDELPAVFMEISKKIVNFQLFLDQFRNNIDEHPHQYLTELHCAFQLSV